ncbi:hypothetical protein OSB04_003721 [Centaurea solstitialis]|uniref:14-3-3 domain-containing protein n=1 Tax=Centaurea solstitialis TaxID=347529 RepID=A0AA38WTX1_9ASTR|nr:hypothetical protein OSB04_003721 [Centaurea solstitialis]
MASSARDQNVYMAKLSEQAERYEEMVEFMEKVSSSLSDSEELTVEERNLLSVAYKNVIGAAVPRGASSPPSSRRRSLVATRTTSPSSKLQI